MPDYAFRPYGPATVGTTAASIYTAPALTQVILRSIHIANVSANTPTLNLSIGAMSTATALFYNFPIAPYSSFDWSGFLVLNAADIVQCQASIASSLTITLSGVAVS